MDTFCERTITKCKAGGKKEKNKSRARSSAGEVSPVNWQRISYYMACLNLGGGLLEMKTLSQESQRQKSNWFQQDGVVSPDLTVNHAELAPASERPRLLLDHRNLY